MRNEDRPKWFKVKAVFLRQCKDTACHYCGVLITKENESVDHKHPIAKGGGVFDLNNLALCCKKCNRLKSDMDYDYFKQNRKQILQDLFKRIKEKQGRREELERLLTINASRDLKDWFVDSPFFPNSELEISKFRTPHKSLVRFSPNSIEFNFNANVSDEQKELIKERVWGVLQKFGTPVKAMKNYVDDKGQYIHFENRVILNMETFTQKIATKKDLGLFRNGLYNELEGDTNGKES